ncbi:class I SAM-dependent methyltransferase [Kribbella antibiotica]|uniref:Class I SAM-dependent methyltransferase n=1 Tax=Kribbella antibiotica TaxID=190195 RepID=A0A4R4ZK42_9ACTN|nr:class I SAM-dependent methyltransferase [Kribbella antibiotica]TDD57939.1 class I SAM-dependent methyltransferase [Kribbella antibiotica]
MTIHDEREFTGRLEAARVRELLRQYLPEPPARVADIGGGQEIHSPGLRADGYDVRMLGPHPREAQDEEFDAAFLPGLMYLLANAADRRAALQEAVRVTRYGGFVAAVAINRTAARSARTAYHSVAQLRSELMGAGLRAVEIHGLSGPGDWLSVMVDSHYSGLSLPDSDPAPLQAALECARLGDWRPDLVQSSPLLLGVGQRD